MAGLRSDWHQLNQLQSKDRLGANGLVNKGMNIDRESRIMPSFEDAARKTNLNESHQKKWIHNDNEKPHQYYSSNAWANSRSKSLA
jgi:hypothetical protein